MRWKHSSTTAPYKRAHRASTGGYSILEMLGYVAIMAVGVNLCASLFVTSMRLSALGSEGLERVQGMAAIEQGFRDAVRTAEAIVPRYGSYSSGPNQLVLRAGTVDGAARYIVLGALRDANHLSRMIIIDYPGKPEAASFLTYPLPIDALHFEAQESSRLARMTYSLKLDRDERRARGAMGHAVAALRGIGTGENTV